MHRGELFIVSAPSGTGKTTLIHKLMSSELASSGNLHFSVSHTTRAPRGSEEDGRDYHFIDRESFGRMIEADEFLEWAEYTGNYYGTSVAEVEPRLQRGIDVVLEIEVKGAERVRERCPEAHAVFVMPPSYQVLHDRLVNRGLEALDARTRRLAVSLSEIRRYESYDYVIINDDLRRASEVLAAIVLEKRHRVGRSVERARELLEDFESHLEPTGQSTQEIPKENEDSES